MTRIVFCWLGLLAAAASPASASCNHTVKVPWTSAKSFGLQLSASSVGETCGTTALLLTVSTAKGDVLWATSFLAQQVSIFSGDNARTDVAMKATLKDWVTIGQGKDVKLTTTKVLPDWKQGEDRPLSEGEFGFFIDESKLRDTFLELRAKNLPMFCFVQGMESEGCIVAEDKSTISNIGGYTFPG